MSRIYYDDEYEGSYALHMGRWERLRRVVWTSKRGQKALRDVEAALLALEPKELYEDSFARAGFDEEEGQVYPPEVCVLGAYAAYKLQDKPEADFIDELERADLIDNDWEQAEYASKFGMTHTMAWLLMEKNDETYGSMSPHERYDAMLAFVQSKLAPVLEHTP
jgi:hypothetical protein